MLILRRIAAVLGGFIVIAVLSTLVDTALEQTIWPGLAHAEATTAQWIVVTLYRAVISIFGCWLAARLAPDHPMGHALALGVFGVAISSLGLFVMWGVGPLWYPIALIVIALPCAWLGGRLYQRASV
jgi:hypothetical protein